MDISIDAFDAKLLELLQTDNRATLDVLGHRLNLSPTAVRRRIKRLREAGIIVADVSLVDPSRLGITVIVSVRFAKESHATYEAFKKRMRAAREVAQCYTVSGEVDFIVIAHFPSLEHYDRWVGANLLSDSAIARSDTNIVYSRVKYETAVHIACE